MKAAILGSVQSVMTDIILKQYHSNSRDHQFWGTPDEFSPSALNCNSE